MQWQAWVVQEGHRRWANGEGRDGRGSSGRTHFVPARMRPPRERSDGRMKRAQIGVFGTDSEDAVNGSRDGRCARSGLQDDLNFRTGGWSLFVRSPLADWVWSIGPRATQCRQPGYEETSRGRAPRATNQRVAPCLADLVAASWGVLLGTLRRRSPRGKKRRTNGSPAPAAPHAEA